MLDALVTLRDSRYSEYARATAGVAREVAAIPLVDLSTAKPMAADVAREVAATALRVLCMLVSRQVARLLFDVPAVNTVAQVRVTIVAQVRVTIFYLLRAVVHFEVAVCIGYAGAVSDVAWEVTAAVL
eukprot:gnl/TRDRNA2_/TRDRNA2_79462_c0_seq1.p1 gnl/TRDRNA2_/TRDRNA2_79462_c0~~gnl/TRDRNA2_/TRDRNA2_79462_c0_seq1.p1  ORF type:complete len:128 (+),score=12.43 gnl/TRDRNA2_/TRDRNA2_79462_c0_seq1:319-702(+)